MNAPLSRSLIEMPFAIISVLTIVWTGRKNLSYVYSWKGSGLFSHIKTEPVMSNLNLPLPCQFYLQEKVWEEVILPTYWISQWVIKPTLLHEQRDQAVPWPHWEDVQLKRGNILNHVSSQLFLLQQHFWWSLIIPEISIAARAVWACSKDSHLAPGSLQTSLSIPHQPWSHTALDCVT